MRQKIAPWVPAGFCAFLSLLPLVAGLGPDTGWWKPAFYCFLPMCFVFVGGVTARLQAEVSELRKQVAELQKKQGGRDVT